MITMIHHVIHDLSLRISDYQGDHIVNIINISGLKIIIVTAFIIIVYYDNHHAFHYDHYNL